MKLDANFIVFLKTMTTMPAWRFILIWLIALLLVLFHGLSELPAVLLEKL